MPAERGRPRGATPRFSQQRVGAALKPGRSWGYR